ncbi:hypothetical protein [Cryptosporangium minutisporangium]|uniref:Uncharacterized protein n=1 Tax=Cryptosporangium minutisporangium TaxID=113569 RepID=A0ABP6T4C1_9ACTN
MATARGHWDLPPGWKADPEDTADDDVRFIDPEDLADHRLYGSWSDRVPVDAEDAAFDVDRPRVEEYLAL